METNQQNQKETEIDLLELVRVIWSKKGYIILAAVIMGVLALAVSKLLLTPQYKSTTKMYVLAQQNSSTVTSSDLQASTQLSKDFAEIIQSREVLESVIDQLGLEISYEGLLGKMTVSTGSDTRIVAISVTDEEPETACRIADAIRETAATHIQKVMNMEAVNVVDKANVPKNPFSPNTKKNVLISTFLGAFLAIAVVVVIYLINDTIQTSEDVERYLGVSVLGTIPLAEGEQKSKKRKSGRSRSQSARSRNR